MERIASFTVNHDILEPGMYVSRVDGDVVTYDVRLKKPNGGEYLPNAGIHTFEHLFATYARNAAVGSEIVYVGPMGCRTGFYLLVRNSVDAAASLELVRDAFRFIADFTGEIPGTSAIECGNYREHSLVEAKTMAAEMLPVLENWSVEKMQYN